MNNNATRENKENAKPVLGSQRVDYQVAESAKGTIAGGIGALHRVAVKVGLVGAINKGLKLLKRHVPYWESDHVLSIAFNILCGGAVIEDMELRRSDEALLAVLGARRLPDPTTAGDFCRRFSEADIVGLMDSINESRLKVWAAQPEEFFDEAIIEADGTHALTTGECKEGMDITYKGEWGYHPLLISLANTQEPLYLMNRSGNRPSYEGAAEYFDKAIKLCRDGGFRRILLRGDTDFSQTAHLDRWDGEANRFLFGFNAMKGLQNRADEIPENEWLRLERAAKYTVATEKRTRPSNVKDVVVRERGYKNIILNGEHVAEFSYRPHACKKTYRMLVVRKDLSIEQKQMPLISANRYFFYITNDTTSSAAKLVVLANQRCDQENLIDQLKNGVSAMRMPTGNLQSNWAYMVMASLAWTLKAWFALLLPAAGRWEDKYAADKKAVLNMGFKKFLQNFILIPAQFVRTGRRAYLRVLGWTPWLHVLLRGADRLEAVGLV